MPQNFPTTAKIIYDTLVADSNITDKLGTYEFKAGQTTDAISIVSAGEDLPSLRNVQGLEVVIQDAGDITQRNYYTEQSDLIVTWPVFVICWQPSTGADMQSLTEAICRRFANSRSVQTVAVSDGLGALTQTKIMVMSDMPILAAN